MCVGRTLNSCTDPCPEPVVILPAPAADVAVFTAARGTVAQNGDGAELGRNPGQETPLRCCSLRWGS